MRSKFILPVALSMMILASCGNAAAQGTGQAGVAETARVENTVQQDAADQTDAANKADAADQTDAANKADAADQAEATDQQETIPYWSEDSEVMRSLIAYVNAVTDETSDNFVPAEDRIVVFDFDGTLYGELFPTYFDESMMLYRVLHDDTYEAAPEVKEIAQAQEDAYRNGLPQPENALSTSQVSAEAFGGMTLEEYRAFVRTFMQQPVMGFENMTYGEGFYLPMVSVVEYLADRDFKVFISSGTERTSLRELTSGTLDKWVPSERIIGTTYSLEATGQGSADGRKYTMTADDEIVMEGHLVLKNQNTNKVFLILNEIGKAPILVFGNSSGDLAMGQYTVQHGGKGFMLLCDDTERDYGSLEKAAKFEKQCEAVGLETVSMKNDFATIYKTDAVKTTQAASEEPAEVQEDATTEMQEDAGQNSEDPEEELQPAA